MRTLIIKLCPNIVRKIWGGTLLSAAKGVEGLHEGLPVGESWEVSNLDLGPSRSLEGREVSEFLQQDSDLPYLVKLIDTSDFLSIQVHPDDEYARKKENSSGKTECWVILEAAEGAGVYLGLKRGVTKECLQRGVKEKEDISQFLNFFPVKRGDFFYVPAGTIHAIGSGVFLAEVQQSCGITYRVWDWNRVQSDGRSRELHVSQAMDVIRFGDLENEKEYFKFKYDLFALPGEKSIINHLQFHLRVINLEEGTKRGVQIESCGRVSSILCVSGSIKIQLENREETLDQYQSALIPITNNLNIDIFALKNAQLLLIN